MTGRNFDWQASATHYLSLFSNPKNFKDGVPEPVTAMLRSMLHEGAWDDQVRWLVWCDALDEWGQEFACHVARYIRSFEPICWTRYETQNPSLPQGGEADSQTGRPVLPNVQP